MAYETITCTKIRKGIVGSRSQAHHECGRSKLSKDEVVDLIKSAQDGTSVTETEKATLAYIRNNFEFTEAAAKDFDTAFTKL